MKQTHRMQKLYQHPDNPILIQEQRCYLQGMEPQPIFLWEIQPREASAKENIQKALTHEGSLLHFFIGIEHLPSLIALWPATHQAIVIEKSDYYAAQYLQGKIPKYPSNIIVHILEDGIFYRHQESSTITDNFIHQFCLDLAMQLFHNHSHWANYQIWHILLSPHEETYAKYLRFIIRLVHAAKHIHQHFEKRYEEIKITPKDPNKITYLLFDELDYINCDFFNYLLRHKDVELIILKHKNIEELVIDKNPDNHYFNENDDVVFFEKRFKISVDTLIEIITKIENNKPSSIILRCLTIISRIEYFLFIIPMLKACNIPNVLFFIDYYQHQCDSNIGGAFFNHFFKYFASPQDKLYLCDIIPAKVYTPTSHPTHYFIPNYFSKNIPTHQPCTQQENIYDILLIHYSRDIFSQTSLISSFFEIIISFAPNNITGLTHFLITYQYLLRHFVQDNWLGNQSECLMLMNMLDWYFYVFLRTYLIKVIITKFKSDFNIKVIGPNWDKIIPRENCLGEINHQDLPFYVQHSGVVIHTFPNWSCNSHHHGVYEYYNMGGLVLETKPFYHLTEQELQVTHPLLQGNHSIYYSDLDELKSLTLFYINNFDKRNKHILQVQNDLANLKKYLRNSKLENLKNNIIPNNITQDNQLSKLTGNPDLDNQLLHAGLGFLHFIRGYHQQAKYIWGNLFENGFKSDILKKLMEYK